MGKGRNPLGELVQLYSWKLVANPGWQPGFPTSFQLVRLVGCGLNGTTFCSSFYFTIQPLMTI